MKQYLIDSIRQSGSAAVITLVPRRPKDALKFYAGQYAALGFRGTNGRPTPLRCFSIASSPQQQNYLQFGVKVEGDFTSALTALNPGDGVLVGGPYGEFVIDESFDRQVVAIAGGIGITPFISMIQELTDTGSTLPFTLLYSVRDGSNVAFLNELQRLAGLNPYFRYRLFVTNTGTAPETATAARIQEQDIRSASRIYASGTTYFLCGPSSFVDTHSKVLAYNGVSEQRIMSESFRQSGALRQGSGLHLSKLTYALTGGVLAVAIAGIAGLDLSRYVPSHTSPTVSATAVSTQSEQTDDATNSSSDTTAEQPTPAPTTTTQSTAPHQYQYRQPMSSVS